MNSMRVGALVAGLAIAGLTACDSGEGTAAWEGSVTDSAGIRVVSNPSVPLWDQGEGWVLEEELSIGTLDGDLTTQFGAIAGVDVDSAGHIYIADAMAGEVRVFDPTGAYVRSMGRQGQGPGELGQINGLVVAGNEVLVPDLGNRRVNVFTLEGESLRSFPIDLSNGVPVRWDEGLDGEILAQIRPLSVADTLVEVSGDDVVSIGLDGTTGETVLKLAVGESVQFQQGQQRQKMLGSEPVWDAGSDGSIVYGRNSEYRMEIRNPAGELRTVVTRDFVPEPFTERDQGVFISAIEEAIEAQGAPAAAVEQYFANLSFAEYYPAFVIILAGPDGSLWVQRIRTGNDLVGEEATQFDPQDLGSNEWEVFDREGRYLGVVEVPLRFQPVRTLGDRFYGVARDEYDVQSLKVFRLVR